MRALQRDASEMTAQQRALAEVAAHASTMTERLFASNSTGDRAMATFVDTFFAMIPLDGSARSINGNVTPSHQPLP